MDKLQCMLCQAPYKVPKMCPHCSQIFCYQCITDYLATKHFCPICDNYIIDLVDCARIMEEVQQMVIQRRKSEQLNKRHKDLGSLKCIAHNLDLNYFCRSCSKWICSDCGVIDEEHRGHSVLQKEQAAEISKKLIIEEVRKADELIYKLHTKKQKFYKTELKWCRTRIQQYFQNLLDRLNEEGSKQIKEYDDRIKQHDKSLQNLKAHKERLQVLMNSKRGVGFPQLKLVEEEEEIESFFNEKIMKIDTINEVIPEYTNFTFEFDYGNNIDEFFQYSPYYELWGQEWRIKIYPKGNSAADKKYLSVFLELTNGYEKEKRYVYRIELLSLNKAGSTIIKQFSSVFGPGQSWGYSDYLDLNNINDYVHEGRLIFSVGIRNETFAGLANDLKEYSKKISRQNKILQQLLCQSNYQKQLQNRQFQESREISLVSSQD